MPGPCLLADLPAPLLDRIADLLAGDDIRSLARLGATSKAWLARCQCADERSSMRHGEQPMEGALCRLTTSDEGMQRILDDAGPLFFPLSDNAMNGEVTVVAHPRRRLALRLRPWTPCDGRRWDMVVSGDVYVFTNRSAYLKDRITFSSGGVYVCYSLDGAEWLELPHGPHVVCMTRVPDVPPIDADGLRWPR